MGICATCLMSAGCTRLIVEDSLGRPISGASGVLLYAAQVDADIDPYAAGDVVAWTGLDGAMLLGWYYPQPPRLIAVAKVGYRTATVPFVKKWSRRVTLLRINEDIQPRTTATTQLTTELAEEATTQPN